MKILAITLVGFAILTLSSCRQEVKQALTDYPYYDTAESDTLDKLILLAVTDEEALQYGARVAYVNLKGDTIIPFGKYAYYGADTLVHYANVIEHPNDSNYGRQIAITRDQKILFDLVMFDNGSLCKNSHRYLKIGKGNLSYKHNQRTLYSYTTYSYASHSSPSPSAPPTA